MEFRDSEVDPLSVREANSDSVPVFLTIVAMMLVAPLLFERFKLSGIVGLILAGVVVGPSGLRLLARNQSDDLKYNADQAVVFGIATFAVRTIILTFYRRY